MADVAQPLARLVEQLRGERSAAHARAISLENAEDLADAVRGDAQPGADARADGVRRGDERIGAEVHVQKRSLRAFGQNGLVLREAVVDEIFAVDDVEAAKVFDRLEPLLLQLGNVVLIVETLQNLLVARLGRSVDAFEIGTQQIPYAHAVAAYLVGIGGTDALARRADLGAALGRLVRGVEHAVRGQDQVGLLRNAELFGQVMAAGSQRFGLLAEKHRVDHHAVADDVGLAALENARRNRAEHVFLAVEFQRVTGIGTALEAGHHLVTRRQHVHNLPFALVTPLQAEDNVNFFHCIRFCFMFAKDIFCIQRYELLSEKPKAAAGLFNKL